MPHGLAILGIDAIDATGEPSKIRKGALAKGCRRIGRPHHGNNLRRYQAAHFLMTINRTCGIHNAHPP